jgi:hypothetical protein
MPIAAIEFHDPIAACPRSSPYRIALPHRPAHPSQPEGHSPPIANNRFLPLPPGQRPRLDPHRDQASVIAVSPPKPPAWGSPVGHPPTDPRGRVGACQQRTACWTTIHLQMRFETSNLPMAIHQKCGPYIGTRNNRSFYPYCREIRLDFDKRHGYRGTMRRFNFTKHVPCPTINKIQHFL